MILNRTYGFVRWLTTIIVVVALMTPGVLKLIHTFTDHHHEVCTTQSNEHIHKQEVNCDFQNYHLSPQLVVPEYVDNPVHEEIYKPFYNSYTGSFQKDHLLSSNWRAPPRRLS